MEFKVKHILDDRHIFWLPQQIKILTILTDFKLQLTGSEKKNLTLVILNLTASQANAYEWVD